MFKRDPHRTLYYGRNVARANRGKRYPHSSAKQHAKCAERDYMIPNTILDVGAWIICTMSTTQHDV